MAIEQNRQLQKTLRKYNTNKHEITQTNYRNFQKIVNEKILENLRRKDWKYPTF